MIQLTPGNRHQPSSLKQLGLGFVMAVGWWIISSTDKMQAQLIPDNTLGAEGSVVSPIDQLNERIDGGASRGANLFHSFLEFNIEESRGVYFANPVGVENILSRVTGSNPSNIFGKLGVLGNANLFLINPNGILFGSNASLDVQGSFLATTADGIQLGNTGYFSATQPQNSNLLSVSPSTLFFNQVANQPTAITNEGNLSAGQNLTLSAENLDLQGQLRAGGNLTLQAQDTVKVRDSAASPFIASAVGQLVVQGNQAVDILALNHPDSGFFSGGDMVLRSANTLGGDAHYSAGGNFRIEQLDGSLGNLSSPYDPIIRANGDVLLNSYIGASLHIFAGGSVEIDTIIITDPDTSDFIAEDVTLSDGSTLAVDGSQQPTLDVRAGLNPAAVGSPIGLTGNNFIDIDGSLTSTANRADITVGSIFVIAPDGVVFLTNQYQPNPSLQGDIQVGEIFTDDFFFTGNGGSVIIDSRSSITVTNDIDSSSTSGNSGNITLLANDKITTTSLTAVSDNFDSGAIRLTSRNGAIDTAAGILNASTGLFGRNGGDVRLQAQGDISLFRISSDGGINGGSGDITITSNTGIVSVTDGFIISDTFGSGAAGNININARAVSVSNSIVDASTFGSADAGSVIINADDTVSVDQGSTIRSLVGFGGVGNSGGITINTGSLLVTDDAELNSSVTAGGQGRAGDVVINARDNITFDGGFARSRLELDGVGRGGDIRITTGSLLLTGIPPATADATIGQLVTATFGEGDAGDVIIRARDSVSLDGRGSDIWTLVASNRGEGNGGDILIESGSFSMTNQSRLVSTTEFEGDAGDITINTGAFSITNGSSINASTPSAFKAGNITVNADTFEAINGGQLNTLTGGSGRAGNITLGSPNRMINRVTISGENTGLFANTGSQSSGKGGDISIYAGSLSLSDGGVLLASTGGSGTAGRILVQASDEVVLNNAQIQNNVRVGATGSGNQINIQAPTLTLDNNAQLNSSTSGQGSAGSILVQKTDLISLNHGSIISTAVEQGAVGEGGDIDLQTSSLSLDNQAQISSSTTGVGDTGQVSVQATNTISLNNGSQIRSAVEAGGTGDGQGINLTTQTLSLTNNAELSASTAGVGDAGNILVRNANAVLLDNSSITSAVNSTAVGQGGNVDLQTRNLSLTNNADISAETSGIGNAGNILVRDANSVSLSDNSLLSTAVNAQAEGKGGNVAIQTESLTLDNNAQISSSTAGVGDTGQVSVQATNTISLNNGSQIRSAVEAGATGDGQEINLTTQTLSLTNNAELSASTAGVGDAGDILVNQANAILLDNSSITSAVKVGAVGQGGSIELQTQNLSLTRQANISAATSGTGKAGNISVHDAEIVSLSDNSLISTDVNAQAKGKGGNVAIQTELLTLDNNAQISSSTAGVGDTGQVSVQATNTISLTNNSQIRSVVEVGATGNGQQINLTTPTLSLMGGAGLSASTSGRGNAGSIIVRDANSVALNNSAISTAVNSGAEGKGGNVDIQTGSFSLNNQASLSANTAGLGDAGNIIIHATDQVSLNASSASSAVETQAIGQGGNVEIIADSVSLKNGALLSASTAGVGDAGSISVVSADQVKVTNSRIESVVTPTAVGNGGDIEITSNSLSLKRSQITSNSQGISDTTQLTGNAGNITITARQNLRTNAGEITATSTQGGGGNITVSADEISLRNSSLISTRVFDGTGGGGNITVDSAVFIALEDSDILANAFQGAGGNITINSEAFLADFFSSGKGTAVGRNPGDFDQFRGNQRVDISASSTLGISGSVTIPDFTFLQSSLSSLSGDFVSPDQVVANSCLARRNVERGSFTVTGTGGIPDNPYDALRGQYELVSIQPFSRRVGEQLSLMQNSPLKILNWHLGDPVTEAQGIRVTADGHLIADATPQLRTQQAQDLICHSEHRAAGAEGFAIFSVLPLPFLISISR